MRCLNHREPPDPESEEAKRIQKDYWGLWSCRCGCGGQAIRKLKFIPGVGPSSGYHYIWNYQIMNGIELEEAP